MLKTFSTADLDYELYDYNLFYVNEYQPQHSAMWYVWHSVARGDTSCKVSVHYPFPPQNVAQTWLKRGY